MMPNEASKERKPKHDLERLAEGMETESAEPAMPDFMKDAEALLALETQRDKMIDQKTELSKAGNVLELKPGVASGAIDKEIDALQDKVNAVLGKYGKEANAFQVDAYRVGELKDNVADAEAVMRGLEADYKSEKNRDAKAKLERQLEDATAAWQEARNELSGMKDKYVAKEAAAKAELAGATDAEIDKALEPLDEGMPEVDVDLTELNEEVEKTQKAEMAKETEDALKMAMDASAEALKEKADRAKAMEARVDARLKEEDEMAKETEDAIKMTMEASAEALAEEGKRDTLPDAGMAGRMEKAAEEDGEWEEVDTKDLEPDTAADTLAEQAFFAKGEVMNQAHEAGKTLEYRNKAERAGDVGAERQEMALEAEKLRGQMPEMNRQLQRAEKYLNDLGVKDVDAAMAKRATGGFAEKAKGFLGGLFSKKTRELNHAMDLYQSVLDQHNEMSEKLGKLDMQLNPTDRQKAMARIASENRQGR